MGHDRSAGDPGSSPDDRRTKHRGVLLDAGIRVNDDRSDESSRRMNRVSPTNVEWRGGDRASLSSACRPQSELLVCREHAAFLAQVECSALDGHVTAGHAPGREDLAQLLERSWNRTVSQNAAGARHDGCGDSRNERPGGLFVMPVNPANLPAGVEVDTLLGPRDGGLERHQVVGHPRVHGVMAHQRGQLEIADWQASRIDDEVRVRELRVCQRFGKFSRSADHARRWTHRVNPAPILAIRTGRRQHHRRVPGDRCER